MFSSRPCLIVAMNIQGWLQKNMHELHVLLSVNKVGGSTMHQPWWTDVWLDCSCDAGAQAEAETPGKQQTTCACVCVSCDFSALHVSTWMVWRYLGFWYCNDDACARTSLFQGLAWFSPWTPKPGAPNMYEYACMVDRVHNLLSMCAKNYGGWRIKYHFW